jgi:hypothetical protein
MLYMREMQTSVLHETCWVRRALYWLGRRCREGNTASYLLLQSVTSQVDAGCIRMVGL